jgi:hypothetical protein
MQCKGSSSKVLQSWPLGAVVRSVHWCAAEQAVPQPHQRAQAACGGAGCQNRRADALKSYANSRTFSRLHLFSSSAPCNAHTVLPSWPLLLLAVQHCHGCVLQQPRQYMCSPFQGLTADSKQSNNLSYARCPC